MFTTLTAASTLASVMAETGARVSPFTAPLHCTCPLCAGNADALAHGQVTPQMALTAPTDPSFAHVAPTGPVTSAGASALLCGTRWDTADAASGKTVVSYSFASALSTFDTTSYGGGFAASVHEFSAADKDTVRMVLANIAAVCNIEFVEVADSQTQCGMVRYGYSPLPNSMNFAGLSYYPGAAASGGDVWIGADQQGAQWDYYRPSLLLHETLHALGLKHPFEGNVQLSTDENIIANTVMSYSAVAGSQQGALSSYPSEPMALDTAALQALYGAAAHNEGDTVYHLADPEFQQGFRSIWDSAGTDTFDASGLTQGAVLDLRAGARSDIGAVVQGFGYPGNGAPAQHVAYTATLAIAGGTLIENAIGSAHDDVITGNAADNRIDGGAGTDTVVFSGARAGYVLALGAQQCIATDTQGRDGTDTLVNVERLQFSDGNVALDVNGNAGLAVKILGAVAGTVAAHNESNIGRVLQMLDAGTSAADVAKTVISVALGDPHTNASFVSLIYQNLSHTAPPAGELAYYTGLLDSGAQTQASLALVAADCTMNTANIGLVGLAQTGIDYLPAA